MESNTLFVHWRGYAWKPVPPSVVWRGSAWKATPLGSLARLCLESNNPILLTGAALPGKQYHPFVHWRGSAWKARRPCLNGAVLSGEHYPLCSLARLGLKSNTPLRPLALFGLESKSPFGNGSPLTRWRGSAWEANLSYSHRPRPAWSAKPRPQDGAVLFGAQRSAHA